MDRIVGQENRIQENRLVLRHFDLCNRNDRSIHRLFENIKLSDYVSER